MIVNRLVIPDRVRLPSKASGTVALAKGGKHGLAHHPDITG
jgi:hypothetical protein